MNSIDKVDRENCESTELSTTILKRVRKEVGKELREVEEFSHRQGNKIGGKTVHYLENQTPPSLIEMLSKVPKALNVAFAGIRLGLSIHASWSDKAERVTVRTTRPLREDAVLTQTFGHPRDDGIWHADSMQMIVYQTNR